MAVGLREADQHFVLVDADAEGLTQLVVESIGEQGVAHQERAPSPLL